MGRPSSEIVSGLVSLYNYDKGYFPGFDMVYTGKPKI